MEGFGAMEWEDGRKYEGNFKNDLKHGFGNFTFSDGSQYSGTFYENKQHGFAVYTKEGKKRF